MRSRARRHFLRHLQNPHPEILAVRCLRAQLPDRRPCLIQAATHQRLRALQLLPGCLRGTPHQLPDQLQLHRYRNEPLRQRIVNLPRNACPLAQHRLKFPFHTCQSPPPGRVREAHHRQQDQQLKPNRLVEMRLNRQLRSCCRCAPNSIVVARNHAKRKRPVGQIRVVRRPPRPRVHPSPIESFQLISILHLLRGYKAQTRVVELVVAVPRFDLQSCDRLLRHIVHTHPLQGHFRRHTIHRHVFRIDARNPFQRCKPQRPVLQPQCRRMPTAAALADAHPIRHPKAQNFRSLSAVRHAIQTIAAHPIHAGIRANPQKPACIFQNPDHPRRQLSRSHVHDPARPHPIQPTIIRADPQHSVAIPIERGDHIARKPVLRREIREVPVAKAAQPTQRPHPQRAVFALNHRPNQVAAQSIHRRPRREFSVFVPRQSAPRPDPQLFARAHIQRSHKIVGESVRCREHTRHLSIVDQVQPIRRSRPNIAICGCGQREHHIARQTLRRSEREKFSIVKYVESATLRTHPNMAVRSLRQRQHVLIRQPFSRAQRREFSIPQHLQAARLCPEPQIPFPVLRGA